MKKLLITLTTALLGFTAAQADEVWLEHSRTDWTIKGGCSQQTTHHATSDGGFIDIIDDDENSFWHVSWASGATDNTANHYFIIDRGENPQAADGFRYLPKQSSNGNGYVKQYAIYFTDEIPENVLSSSCTKEEAATIKASSHANMQTFLSSLTPAIDSEFNYTWSGNDVSDHNERKDKFSAPQTGRYLIFVVKSSIGAENTTGATSSGSKIWANCADFKTYTIMEGTKVEFSSSNATTAGALAGSTEYTTSGDAGISISCSTGGTLTTNGDSLLVSPGTNPDTWHTYRLQAKDGYHIVYFKLVIGSYGDDNIKIRYNDGAEQSTADGYVTVEGSTGSPMEFLATTTVSGHAKKGSVKSAVFVLQPAPLVTFKLNDRSGNTIATFEKSENWAPEWSSFATVSENDSKVYVIDNDHEDIYFYHYGSQKYIYSRSADNAQFQLGLKADIDDSSRFCMIPTKDGEGYVLLSYSDGKFLSELNGNGSKMGHTPATCYYGRIPVDQYHFRSWFGVSKNASDNAFFNQFGGGSSTNIGGWTYNSSNNTPPYDPGSLMVVIRDLNIFPENVAKENELVAAIAAAKAIVADDSEDNTYDTEALQAAITAAEAFDLGKDPDIQRVIDALNPELYQADLVDFLKRILGHAGLFTIQEATAADSSLGYLCYDNAEDGIRITDSADANNSNHLWGFVNKDGKYYLYNAGAKLWANAWATATANKTVNSVAEYAWQLSEIPTEVNLAIAPFDRTAAPFDGTYRITGGENPKGNGAGMMVTANDGYKVAVASKTTKDANGFKFTMREMTSSVKSEMETKLELALEKAKAAVEEAWALEEAADGVVGHYADLQALYSELNKIGAETPIDKQFFLVEKGMDAISSEENIQLIADEKVYRIMDSDGNHYYVEKGVQKSTVETPEDNDTAHNWKAAVQSGSRVVSFSHSYADTSVPFTVGDNAEFTYQFTETPGQVKLTPANTAAVAAAMRAAEADDTATGLTYVISRSNGDAVTTSISEITADDETRVLWYDLQGRRVAQPKNGIFINSKGRKHVFAN